MKITHIIGILVIAVAIVIITTTAGSTSEYVTFSAAKEMADGGSEKQIHVVGTLKTDTRGNIFGISPSPDKLSFEFVMVDNDGKEEVVFHPNPMPTDFTKSEQVVVVGRYSDTKFVANKILLKCPSKYEEEEIKV